METKKTTIIIMIMMLSVSIYTELDYTMFDYSNVDRADFANTSYPEPVQANNTDANTGYQNFKQVSQPAPEQQLKSHPRYVPVKTVEVLASGYYGPTKDQPRYSLGTYHREILMNGEGKQTFYGTKPRIGIVATDPRIFEKGTLLLIKDPLDGKRKIFVAEDTGERIKGKRIDIFTGFGMPGLISAEKIGMQRVSVVILKEKSA